MFMLILSIHLAQMLTVICHYVVGRKMDTQLPRKIRLENGDPIYVTLLTRLSAKCMNSLEMKLSLMCFFGPEI
jgi:hypothetical protein